MKIAIVQDGGESVNRLKDLIKRFCGTSDREASAVCFSDGIDIVSDYSADYDVIFLAVKCKHMSGLKTAEMIRERDKNVLLYFMSENIEDAVLGYAVEAFGFLLLPVEYDTLKYELERCTDKLRAMRRTYILFSTENGMDRVPIDSIMYIESQDHKKIVFTAQGQYVMYGTMDSIEQRLPKNLFSRCNNSFIVNLSYIKGVHGEFVIVGDKEIKITRSRRKMFLRHIERYFSDTPA